MDSKTSYVVYPHEDTVENPVNLTPADKLIYLCIRRYKDFDGNSCFVSYAKITSDCGASAKTIKKCVDNLVREGYLETKREGRKIIYIFNEKKKFEVFSYDFLDNKELSFTEKSYIVATQQYMFKSNNNQKGTISFSNGQLSEIIHMPKSTISKINRSLQEKGYLDSSDKSIKTFDLGKLVVAFAWKLKEHEEKIEENADEIRALKERVRELEEQVKQNKRTEYIL